MCVQEPAENPGMAVAKDCRITALQTAAYSTLMDLRDEALSKSQTSYCPL